MFKNQIKFLRKERRFTQKQLAEILNVSQQTVGSWESGRTTPDETMIRRLAELFGVSIDFLYGYDVPEWAEISDALDLDRMLDSNIAMTYGGEELTESEKQRVKDVLTTVFWEKTHKERDENAR